MGKTEFVLKMAALYVGFAIAAGSMLLGAWQMLAPAAWRLW